MATRFPKLTLTDIQGQLLGLNRNFELVATALDQLAAQIPAVGVTAQIAYATGNLTLSTSFADVPGVGVAGLGPGTYLVIGVFCMSENGAGDVGQYLAGIVALNGNPAVKLSPLGRAAVLTPQAAGEAATVAQQWKISAPQASNRISLQAAKQGGTGTSACLSLDTSILVLYLGPPS